MIPQQQQQQLHQQQLQQLQQQQLQQQQLQQQQMNLRQAPEQVAAAAAAATSGPFTSAVNLGPDMGTPSGPVDPDSLRDAGLMYAPQVLRAIDELTAERKAAGIENSHDTSDTLRTVRRDAMHNVIQNLDKQVFEEMNRLKGVELKYLHQVRGIRQVMPSAIFGDGYVGYGNGWTGNKMRLLYAQDRKRGGRESREVVAPVQVQESTRFLDEDLVPLRIDFKNDKFRLQDTLVWNRYDDTIGLDIFVENLLEDFCLPLGLASQIVPMLREQLRSYIPHPYGIRKDEAQDDNLASTANSATVEPDTTDPQTEEADEEGEDVMDITESTVSPVAKDSVDKTAESEDVAANTAGEQSAMEEDDESELQSQPESQNQSETLMPVAASAPAAAAAAAAAADAQQPHHSLRSASRLSQPNNSSGNGVDSRSSLPQDEDMRFTVKLDITVGQHNLTDQFEWDLNCRENEPEEFGVVLARELALPAEFATAIAYSIREQCQAHTRILYSSGHPFDGRPVANLELREEFMAPVTVESAIRSQDALPVFTPVLHQLSGAEADQQDYDRDSRRRRRLGRSFRRGGTSQTQYPTTVAELREPNRLANQPIYSSILPGGIDKNLDILRMYICNTEDAEGDREVLRTYLKLRETRGIPSASLFSLSLPRKHNDRYIITLRLPGSVLSQIGT